MREKQDQGPSALTPSRTYQPLPTQPPYQGYSATWTPVQFSLLSEVMARYSELWEQSQVDSDPFTRLAHRQEAKEGLVSAPGAQGSRVRERRGDRPDS